MPLVIYGLGGVRTHTHARAYTHILYTRALKVISRNQARAWFKNSKLYNQLLKKCVDTTIVAHTKANMKAGIQASYIILYS